MIKFDIFQCYDFFFKFYSPFFYLAGFLGFVDFVTSKKIKIKNE